MPIGWKDILGDRMPIHVVTRYKATDVMEI
jgi:hypothetical protein